MPGEGLSSVASAANEPSNSGSKNSGLERAFGKLPTAYIANSLPRRHVLTEHMCVYRVYAKDMECMCILCMQLCVCAHTTDNFSFTESILELRNHVHTNILILQRKLKLTEVK